MTYPNDVEWMKELEVELHARTSTRRTSKLRQREARTRGGFDKLRMRDSNSRSLVAR